MILSIFSVKPHCLFVSGCGFSLSILTHYTCQNFSRISETISINSSRNGNDGNVRMEIYLAPSLNLVENPVVSSWKSASFQQETRVTCKNQQTTKFITVFFTQKFTNISPCSIGKTPRSLH
jgi:hypothetical protein